MTMGLFSAPKPPDTVSDKTWGKVKQAAQRAAPSLDVPGDKSAGARKKALWNNASGKAASN